MTLSYLSTKRYRGPSIRFFIRFFALMGGCTQQAHYNAQTDRELTVRRHEYSCLVNQSFITFRTDVSSDAFIM